MVFVGEGLCSSRGGLLFDNNRMSVIKPSVLLRAHHDTPVYSTLDLYGNRRGGYGD